MIFTVLREEYLKLVRTILASSQGATLSASYQYCTARLIHLFEWLTEQGSQSIQITRREIYEKLLEEHGKDAITAGIRFLSADLGLLRIETNNRQTNGRNGQSKTYRYWLDWDHLLELLSPIVQNGAEDASTKQGNCSISNGDSSIQEGESSKTEGDCSTTYIEDPSNNPSNTPTTTDEGSDEEITAAIAASSFMQEEVSAEFKKPAASFNNLEPIKTPLEFPQAQQLKLHGVNLGHQGLQRVAANCGERLSLAVAAWLEWAKSTEVKKPTRSLLQAIREGWKPKQEITSRSSPPIPKDPPKSSTPAVTIEWLKRLYPGDGWKPAATYYGLEASA